VTWLWGSKSAVRFRARRKKFLPLHYSHISSAPPATYSKDNEDIYPENKLLGCEVNHSHPPCSEVPYARNLPSWCGERQFYLLNALSHKAMHIWNSEHRMQTKFKKYCFRNVMPCRMVKMYQSLGANCLHLQRRISKDGSWCFLEAEQQISQQHKTEDCGPTCFNHRCENLISHWKRYYGTKFFYKFWQSNGWPKKKSLIFIEATCSLPSSQQSAFGPNLIHINAGRGFVLTINIMELLWPHYLAKFDLRLVESKFRCTKLQGLMS
jgi:hypothetical protein